jgi:hypothetical protein
VKEESGSKSPEELAQENPTLARFVEAGKFAHEK